jgi:3-(3-hydroxy-phenyl)propionate hydroxylase/6-hydroxy-3-succinoylpyridine 3-monooxygenase
VALAGDAAHLTNPTGGLGLTTGLYDIFLDRVGFTMHLGARNEKINIPLDTLVEDKFPYPFNINMGQHMLDRIALDRLKDFPNAQVIFGAEVKELADDGETVTTTYVKDDQERSITSSYLVGADGGKSTVRQLIGATMDGFTWDERFVATNIIFDFDKYGFNPNNLYVHPEHGCVIARLNKDGLWRYTYQEDGALPIETVGDRVIGRLAEIVGEEAAATAELVDFNPYKMHQRAASTFRSGRVALAGDAAHLTNPTGGLGLTTGLYDIFLLQEVLTALIRGEAGEEALDYYATDRAKKFKEISSANATAFKKLVFDTKDVEVQSQGMQPQREASKSPEIQRGFLAATDAIRSEPLASRVTA